MTIKNAMHRILFKVDDLQFPKYFILNETNLADEIIFSILNTDIEITHSGEPDQVIDRSNKIVISNPTSITKFLYNVLYTLLSRHVFDPFQKDKLALGLSFVCYDYCHFDETKEGREIPVLIDSEKLLVVSSIIKEIIEPMVGKIEMCPTLFIKCHFTNSCRIVDNFNRLVDQYGMKKESISQNKFPIVVCNTAISNQAAENTNLLTAILENKLGKDKTLKVIKHILLDTNDNIVSHLIMTLKMLNGIPDFVINFLGYLESYLHLSSYESEISENNQEKAILADKFLSQHIKVAGEGNQQVAKQWTQWSTILGIIEKQLTPMRGSMWPTSTKVKPFEDKLRKLFVEKASKAGKKYLNFSEMLDSYRDLYDHKAIEPGKIFEHVLGNNRVWQ